MLCVATAAVGKKKVKAAELWPDGTEIPAWFSDTSRVDLSGLKQYDVTAYGVDRWADGVQTAQIQAVIDKCAAEGGGVIVIPRGTFLSGSLFFKPGTHLKIEEGGELKGSDRIRDFKIVKTRMEGQTLNYFAALVNADGVDGFTITGPGTINGNGQKYWEEFWIRRKYNPQCTNLEAMRPRNVYISNSKNVTVQDVKIINSPFWTNHLYRCENVRYLGCFIFAPTENVTPVDPRRGGPSTDAIDLDVCKNVLIHGCYMHVNDDAVVLKGGKGTWADKKSDNGGSNSMNLISRALLTPDEILRLQRPYLLVMCSGVEPAITNAPDLSKWNFNKLLGLGDKNWNIKVRQKREDARPIKRITPLELWDIDKQTMELKQKKKEQELEERRLNFMKRQGAIEYPKGNL